MIFNMTFGAMLEPARELLVRIYNESCLSLPPSLCYEVVVRLLLSNTSFYHRRKTLARIATTFDDKADH